MAKVNFISVQAYLDCDNRRLTSRAVMPTGPEYSKRLSMIKKGHWADPEYRKKMSEAKKRSYQHRKDK